MFSEWMPLKEFLNKHHTSGKEYRLRLDSRDNHCNYIDMEFVRVPNFTGISFSHVVNLNDMFYTRLWTWLGNSRFKYFYLYILKNGRCYFADRDNVVVRNFLAEHNLMNKEAATKDKCFQFPWMYEKMEKQDKDDLVRA